MDEYGQIGPEKGDYAADVRAIADALRFAERAVTFALTHRLTRQQVTVALKSSMEVVGEDYGGGPPGTKGSPFVFLAVDEKGAYWFRIDLLVHPSYLASKLGVSRPDAETLCDFLASLSLGLGYSPTPGVSTVTQVSPDG